MSRRPKGFTLVELGVVLAISAVMAAMAWGSMQKMFVQSRVNTQTRLLWSQLNHARAQAVAQGRPIGIYIGQATGTKWAQPVSAVTLFIDNVAAGATSAGTLGNDDTIVDGPRQLPTAASGDQVVQLVAPLPATPALPAAPTNDATGGFSIVFDANGLPAISGTNTLPTTISLAQNGNALTTRSIVLRSSGVSFVQ